MKHKTALLTLAAASVLWSFSGVGTKCMSWNGFAIAGMRSLIAAAVLLPVLRRPRLPRSRYQVLAALSYAGLICLMILATKLTTAANAILLQFTAPAYSAVIGWFVLRERVTRRDIASIALMFAGLVLLLYDGLASGRMLGNVLALLSGVCSGAMNVFMRADPDVKPVQNVFWGNLAAAALTLPFWGALEWTAVNAGIIVFLGTVQLGLAYILYTAGIRYVSALEASMVTVLEPVLNPVWVALIQGERPGAATFAGGAVILCAMLLHLLGHRAKHPAMSG